MPTELREKLENQGYHLLGKRGAFKACQWQKKALLYGDACYKQRFYGIESHRCVQMTPIVDKCTHNCDFCWRITPSDVGISWDQVKVSKDDVVPVNELMDAVLMANLRSLGGYNPDAGAKVLREKYLEAREPKHVAVSLAGEPTLHPQISELIEEIHSRKMTSSLVTNGTRPDVLERMTAPTQLYVTLAAPDETTYKKLCKPGIKNGWQKIVESQEMLHSLNTRTVNRLTMVSGLNMKNPRSYSDLIHKGRPDFVEVKGYMFLGSSRGRLSNENAPSHRDIRAFSQKIADLTGYYLLDEQIESRVVLLSQSKHIKKLQ
ncbi:MAG: 4-demethylwyosine synthase TYW1 [Candidatus Thorarchaeota archaeon]|nr:MAG: 4-demethylwyosine synthase TYW1 [Candidatus Thorarchaeota archaeon]